MSETFEIAISFPAWLAVFFVSSIGILIVLQILRCWLEYKSAKEERKTQIYLKQLQNS
jgi:hypothetical protein